MGIEKIRASVRAACAVVVLAIVGTANAQVEQAWDALFNAAGLGTKAGNLAVDSSNNVIVTLLHQHNLIALKYDPQGNLQWQAGILGFHAEAIDTDGSDNVFIVGDAHAGGSKIVKYDSDGNELWIAQDLLLHEPTEMSVDDAGNSYIAGVQKFGTSGDFQGVTVKYDPNGIQLWKRLVAVPDVINSWLTDITIDSNGNAYVTGNIRAPKVGQNLNDDYVTIKYSTGGQLLWQKLYDGDNSFDRPRSIAVDPSGNAYVTGESRSAITGWDFATIKYDTGGNEIWVSRFDSPGVSSERATAIDVDGAGNIGVTGNSTVNGSFKLDYLTIKYDNDGNLLWLQRYNGEGDDNDRPLFIAFDSGGSMYVSGTSKNALIQARFSTVKYDTDGNLRWVMHYSNPNTGSSLRMRGFALDNIGNVFVSGYPSGSSEETPDIRTVKYRQTAVIVPDSFTLQRGFLTGGGLPQLFASDDMRLDVRAGLTLFLGESPLQVVMTGTSPGGNLTELRFKVEASANTPGLTQTIELFNYVTSSYEQVDLAVPGFSDGIVEVVITTNPGRFVQAGTREMRAKVSYQQVGLTLLWPWSAKLDQAVWTIIP